MTIFWLIAAALILIALILILPTLIRSNKAEPAVDRRQQNILIAREKLADLEAEFQRGSLDRQDYEQMKGELEQGLFDDVSESSSASAGQKKPAWLSAALLTLAVPLATVLIYQQIGDPQAFNPPGVMPAGNAEEMRELIDNLEVRLAEDPTDIDGWLLLGRTYMAEENYLKAEETFTKLLAQEPDNPDFMLLKADAMAMNAGGRIEGEPEQLIQAALEMDPQNFTALWLAGMAARERGDNQTALAHWTKLQGLLPEGSEDLANLNQLVAQLNGETGSPAPQAPDIASMVKQLEDRLEADPQNPTGWLMLGRSYLIMQRFPEAVSALEEAIKQNPDDPVTLLTLADADAMSNGGRMAGRPAELVGKVLAMEPDNPKALWLAGIVARESGDDAKAVEHWQRLLPLISNDPTSTEEVKNLISQAGGTVKESEKSNPGIMSSLEATISLADQFAGQVQPGDTVFIYVKAFNGPPMPLAAARKQVSDLPLTITLDDSMSMIPEMKMSNHGQLIVGARISKTGQAIAASGDLFAEQGPVKSGDKVELTINQMVK